MPTKSFTKQEDNSLLKKIGDVFSNNIDSLRPFDALFRYFRDSEYFKVRSLIYDLSVLFNSIDQNYNAPRFNIHDGIFENLHKTHFFAFVSFIDELIANNTKFQYILTLNDHDYFDEIKDFRLNKIIANTIIQLTPSKPLLGRDF
ncbi:MAG: DUF2326 domain-containing protein [Ignavibacteria bacterium]|nr:DUF2326 domain-containing protein [Ignavibacteria bacterium]MDP3831304.1 DUF2326 domain-containing protein [Ignavibacteriaceae bacterium]